MNKFYTLPAANFSRKNVTAPKNLLITILTTLLFLGDGLGMRAFAQNYQWAKSMGGTSADFGYSIALDGSGNVYTTGYFQWHG